MEILARGTAVDLELFLLLRLVFKREAGSVGITDLLVVVSLAEAAVKRSGSHRDQTRPGALRSAPSQIPERVRCYSPTLNLASAWEDYRGLPAADEFTRTYMSRRPPTGRPAFNQLTGPSGSSYRPT